jgi:hypothetical protein
VGSSSLGISGVHCFVVLVFEHCIQLICKKTFQFSSTIIKN